MLDAHGQPVPIGVPGEIYVGGAGVARGYLDRPELTARALRARSVHGVPARACTARGDLARLLPGRRAGVPRPDRHQVKIRGFRIELGEIEATSCWTTPPSRRPPWC